MRDSDQSTVVSDPPRLMRALQITAPQCAGVVEVPLPEPGPTQVRVRLEGSGVCGSDLPVWEGRPWFEYPRAPGAPGHEGWGVVDAVGVRARDFQVGDRITGLMYHAYAEYDLLEAADAVGLGAELGDMPFPGEPLACAINVMRRSEIRAGMTVAVVGVGFLGALLIQLAVGEGARVFAIARRTFALELAMGMGAAEALSSDSDVPARIGELTGGDGCDVVIEAAGTQATLDLAGSLTRTRGRLVIAGFHQDGPRQVDLQRWNWHGLDVINAHERDPAVYREGLELAVAAVRDGRLDPRPLFTHRISLADPGVGLALVQSRPHDFMKALACP